MIHLIQTAVSLSPFKTGLLSFVTAFVVTLLLMPVLILFIKRFHLYDVPDLRKEHQAPIPTMGGIAVFAGMAVACTLWYRFQYDAFILSFFFALSVLFTLGILDDLHDISARYKFVIQVAVASLIAFSGVRITSFNGLLGIGTLPLTAQYTFTVLAITGITNAFNLIDGIDGLAGGIGFMSLVTLGLFLTVCRDVNTGLIAFALSGGLLGFLYYNFNPARIFMGDTGSLVLGFVTAVLCIRLMALDNLPAQTLLPHAPVFSVGVVLIPVFDTLRVFALRIWKGRSPFHPDKTHIHHLLTNNGWSHAATAKIICGVHAAVLIISYFLQTIPQEAGFLVLFLFMLAVTTGFARLQAPGKKETLAVGFAQGKGEKEE
ncbi:MAG TPA: MraY family glycosyltransferase [Chitinophagaceae bacterium]|jgi:UDP-N-acetylmuramyl pentapeptide phosphotransferase/UDP-N-acetylglucosamine-1-phosphate transferase|nr:MraY family glycosyltransferase [Chitinophagaceae bacterium]